MIHYNIQNAKALEQFSQQAENYGQLTRSTYAAQNASDIISLLQLSGEENALDIACGTGRLTLEIAQQINFVIGIDLTPAMLEQARKSQAASDIKNVDWQNGDAHALPFTTNSFNLVTCVAAYHHLETPQAVLKEMARVCSSPGKLMVIDMTPHPDKIVRYNHIEKMRDPSHTQALTLEELRALGRKIGLTEIHHTCWETVVDPIALLERSFPNDVTRDDILNIYSTDADGGKNCLGLTARYEDGNLMISYPMSAVIWRKQ